MTEDTTTHDDQSDGQQIALNVEGVGGQPALAKVDSSTQLPDRRIRTRGHGIKPPYNPDRLASFLELNETHAAAVRKKSRYEVGFGFDLVPADGVDADDADDVERAVVEDFWRGPNSKWLTGPQQQAESVSPEEVKELARQDHHSIGYECLEVLTNNEGVPVGLAHVPANTVRIRRPQSQFDQPRHPEDGRFVDASTAEYASRGYVQIRDGRRRYFGQFGDRYRGREPTITGSEDDPTVTYTNDDTEEEPIFVDPESGDVTVGDSPANGPANELIFIRNPSPIEQDYGIPDWVSAIRTIAADEAAKDYNRDFFDNDTIPRFVIKVSGGELSEESRRDLKQMLDGLREESHRALILEVEKILDQKDIAGDDDLEIELEPLGQGISEEMDFRQFREKNEHEIAKAHEVPPILIGVTESSNRSNSEAQVRDFARNIIAPEQHKFATRLYKTIHQTALGVSDWTLEYELRGADQPKEDAKVARQKISAVQGAIPLNRALEMIGEDPLPDDHEVDGDTLVANIGQSDPSGGFRREERAVDEPPADGKLGEREWSEVEAALAEKDAIETASFNSSNLDEGLYDFEEQELYLSFERDEGQNSLYAYVDVPATEWSGLTSASSHGSYHWDSIRLEFPYVEITNFHSRLPEGPAPDSDEVPEGVPSEL